MGVRNTSFHCYWECPSNNEIDDPIIQDTANLAHTAAIGAVEYPCLWYRGILPKNLVSLPPGTEPPDRPNPILENPLDVSLDDNHYL